MDFDSLLAPRHSDKLDLTVTFAQSLAGLGGSQIALSCPESMEMTHRLRTKHDAILVGANTAINDNPQLNSMSQICIYSIMLLICIYYSSTSACIRTEEPTANCAG
jgi:RibD C-terminal domain